MTLSATEIATEVRAGRSDPVTVTRATLERIDRLDPAIGAFQVVRHERALEEARALAGHDLGHLPLAGVPVAIKDNVDVAGEPTRNGSLATFPAPADEDHEVVKRLRGAGAIVVGKTRVPELCVWGSTENATGSTLNPLAPSRIAGGSSGGSAAAVAAGMVPLALGADGMGSIRIPAAVCGVVGLKPGAGVVPANLGPSSWFGMAENGVFARDVSDARLMLAALAAAEPPSLATATGSLRIAISTRAPIAGSRVQAPFAAAARNAGRALEACGHSVSVADPPYRSRDALALGARWMCGVEEDARGLDRRLLESRTKAHIRAGRTLRKLGFLEDRHRQDWAARVETFFAGFDLLVTPTLARTPPRKAPWHRKGFVRNIWRDARYAPFPPRWNLARYAAASVPWGATAEAPGLAVQLIARPGREWMLLDVAEELATR